MSDLYMRGDAPLTQEEWEQLDNVVVHVARQFLVGRRFIELAGPFGAGTEVIPVGSGANRKHLPMQVIQADFELLWRDVEANRQLGVPIEWGAAAEAAAKCAKAEDSMILSALSKAAKKKVKLGTWSEPGAALESVVAATEALFDDGFFGPYAVIVSPGLYAQTQRVEQGMGRLVSKLIKDVAQGGLFRTPLLGADQGLVVALGVQNFDLAVAQDLITAYMGNEGLDHSFRVMESLVLRIKRNGAVCQLAK
jgi:uncharacterized linocin/CFP29 family protein